MADIAAGRLPGQADLDGPVSERAEPKRAIASTRSWPGLVAQPERYIIHKNEGLIQVIRSSLKGATKVPAVSARSVISAEYAWYRVIVCASYHARTCRAGTR